MELANLFFVVADLPQAKIFYDLLLDQNGLLRPDSLRYCLGELRIDFHALTAAQARRYKLRCKPGRERVRQGVCLKTPDWGPRLASLERAGARWEVDWGPAPWGGFMAQLTDPHGYRWELASPTTPPPVPSSTHHDREIKPSPGD